jgi:hypothetical protein
MKNNIVKRIWVICSDDGCTPTANHFEPLVRLGFYQDEGLAMDMCNELNEAWKRGRGYADDSDASFYYIMEIPAFNETSLDELMNPQEDFEAEKRRWEAENVEE